MSSNNTLKKNQVRVTAIFGPTIQGEGPLQGRRCFFLRLQGCLRPLCPFCDSLYATPAAGGEVMTMAQVRAVLGNAGMVDGDILVITGGEPFLQNITSLVAALQKGRSSKLYIQVETSGKTLGSVQYTNRAAQLNMIVCSPKWLKGKWQVKDDAISYWLATIWSNTSHYYSLAFKFVVNSLADVDRVKEFQKKYSIPSAMIWLMPLGASKTEQLIAAERVSKLAVAVGYNFSTRLHLITDQQ